MKKKEILIVVLFFLFITLWAIYWIPKDVKTSTLLMIIIPIFIFGFNFTLRGNIRFKKYFTSKYNLLNSKYYATIESKIPKKLMYQKMLEVLNALDVEIMYSNSDKMEILARKRVSWQSWGENIYIDFTEKNGKTQMNFISTTVVGIVSWGKNEKNYNRLLSTYEESLTI